MINGALFMISLRQKLKTEPHLKDTVRKQSNKLQNLQKTLLKADKKNQLHA